MAYVDVDKLAEKICDFQEIDEDAANKMIWLLRTFPTADVVSRAVFDQFKWERDMAFKTLEEHGLSLGKIKEE